MQLAIKSLTKRIYPNVVNCDWTSNDPGVHPTRVVDEPLLNKDYKITCSIDDKFYDSITLEEFYNILPVEEEEKNGYLVKDLRNRDKINITILDTSHSVFSPHIKRFKGMSDEELLSKGMAKANFITKNGDKISVTTDTFTHNYTTLDGKEHVYASEYLTEEQYDPDTEMATMGCRTMIGYDRHGMGYKKTGRGNVAPVTMILPKLGIEYGICLGERKEADVEGFFKAFDDLLDIAEKSLVDRFNYVCSQSIKAGWFMYDNGVIADGEKAAKSGKVYDAMKHGTLAFGYIGIANTCYAMFGKYHHEDPEVMKFADRIISTIKKHADEASERHNLNFSTYSTPAENACYTIERALQKEYGKIKGVTDEDFLTNSLHVPVFSKVSINEKLNTETQLAKYSTGGEINYIELESAVTHNHKAVEQIVHYAMKQNIPYLAINIPIDTCKDCGAAVEEFAEKCHKCGSTNILSLRRVTGYLTTDYRNFCLGKQSETKRRFKHSERTNFVDLVK